MNDDATHDDVIRPPADASWRILVPADLPFLYDLISKVDPRWWRFSRRGLEPSRMLAITRATAVGGIVVDGYGNPVAAALLAETGDSFTGMLEYFALPDTDSYALASRFAPELIAAAFTGASVSQLYYERFENDPDVLGDVGTLFEVEVTFPDFVLIDGNYEARTTSVLTSDRFVAWQAAAK